MESRRSFLKTTALYGAGAMLLPSVGCAAAPRSMGIQLYTLRDIIAGDVKGTIAKVSAAGFTDVETFDYNPATGFWGLSVSDFSNLLKDHGITNSSGHYGFSKLFTNGDLSEVAQYIEVAKKTGSSYITIPWMDDVHRKTLDDYKRHANTFNKAGELCKAAGLQLAYHNHDFEFKKWGAQSGFEILLDQTQKDLVTFEMDIYWVVRSGQDPKKLFDKYAGRFPLWHVKDMDRSNKDLNTEIGKGQIDYPEIFKHAALAGLKRAFVEQETNYKPDVAGSIKSSAKYFTEKLN